MLRCQGDKSKVDDYDNVSCLDTNNKPVSVLDQFTEYLKHVDTRLAEIPKPDLMQTVLGVATNEAKLLASHEFKSERNFMEGSQAERLKRLGDHHKSESKPINGVFYDTRIKKHKFGG